MLLTFIYIFCSVVYEYKLTVLHYSSIMYTHNIFVLMHPNVDLWILQKNGLIEYTVSDAVFAISLQSSNLMLEAIPCSFHHFIKMVATQVLIFFDLIQNANIMRLYDMWRVGMKIHSQCDDKLEEKSQVYIRSLLAHHMDTDLNSKEDIYSIDDVEIPLISKSKTDSVVKFLSMSEQEDLLVDVKTLRRDVLFLLEDSRISHFVECIKNNLISNSTTESSGFTSTVVVTSEEDELRLRALFVCRILHGLGSSLLSSGEWRDSCGQWGRYNQVHFEHLLEFIVEVLKIECLR